MMLSPINHRIASWLLTLPGPFEAWSEAEAKDRARRACDPRLDPATFESTLSQLGYLVTRCELSRFALVPAT